MGGFLYLTSKKMRVYFINKARAGLLKLPKYARINKMDKIKEYINSTKVEMKQVKWPTRHQTILFTVLVIAISVVLAYFLGLFDSIFSKLLEKII